ncbi:hypothetical protein EVAR_52490_1 [Eumeta japonica]|uniref:Uncharacterized protein n=1 Tax=Eumeta variegata TaxID=151549 RepID=A0A4C1ZJ83_EUMVA|nr:hypothetical protein EVAR_52490_1 [Eumeta japonica]
MFHFDGGVRAALVHLLGRDGVLTSKNTPAPLVDAAFSRMALHWQRPLMMDLSCFSEDASIRFLADTIPIPILLLKYRRYRYRYRYA